jgi:hypothetical protein
VKPPHTENMMAKLACGLIFCLLPLTGCAGEGPLDGHCSTRVGFRDTVYRGHNAINRSATFGNLLGEGDLLDCDGTTIGHEQVFAVKDVDPAVAVVVKVKVEGHGIYVAEGVPRSAWPAPLRQP